MTFNGFEYNEYGVCTNPEIYQFGRPPKDYFKIRVSETPRGWVCGFDWGRLTSGGGGPCCWSASEVFETKSKAIVDAAEFIKKHFEERPRNAAVVAELDRIISEESKHRPTLKQYSIFDYL